MPIGGGERKLGESSLIIQKGRKERENASPFIRGRKHRQKKKTILF